MIKKTLIFLVILVSGAKAFAFGWCWSNYGKDFLTISPTVVELTAEGALAKGTISLEVEKAPGVTKPSLGAAYLVFLPQGSRITALDAYMDGAWIPGEWIQSTKAGRLFQGIVGAEAVRVKPKDPVIVQCLGPDIYRVLIFPVQKWYGKVRLHIEIPGKKTSSGYAFDLPKNSWWADRLKDFVYDLKFTSSSGEATKKKMVLFQPGQVTWSWDGVPGELRGSKAVSPSQSLIAIEKGAQENALRWGVDINYSGRLSFRQDDGFGGINYSVPGTGLRLALLYKKLVMEKKTNQPWEQWLEKYRYDRLAIYRSGDIAAIAKSILLDFPGPGDWKNEAKDFRTNFNLWNDLSEEDLKPFKKTSDQENSEKRYVPPHYRYLEAVLIKKPHYWASLLNDLADKFDYYGLWEYPVSPWELFPLLVEAGYGKI